MSDRAEEMSEDMLDGAVHDAVAQWVDAHGDGPDDFADAVVSAWRPPEAQVRTASPAHARFWVAGTALLAAAAAVLLALALVPRASADAPAIAGLDRASGDAPLPVQAVAIGHERGSDRGSEAIPTALGPLREQMRGVLAARCVPCHRGGHDDAQAGALEVFDITAPQWWQPVSARQLGVLHDRVVSAHGEDSREGRLVDAFVDAELAHRRG